METFGSARAAPDDYNLPLLNCYVQLDTLRQRNADLRCRILILKATFLRLRAFFEKDTDDQEARRSE